MNILVTGAAGFIGSNLVDHLLASGHWVTGIDNLSTGSLKFLCDAQRYPSFRLIRADLLTDDSWQDTFAGQELVVHLAANADVRFGPDHPTRDLEQNTIVTQRVLEAMRKHAVKRIAFSSTGSVYGEAKIIPTPEDCSVPDSNFAVRRVESGGGRLDRGLLPRLRDSGASSSGSSRSWASATRTAMSSISCNQLLEHPGELPILGDGTAAEILSVRAGLRATPS